MRTTQSSTADSDSIRAQILTAAERSIRRFGIRRTSIGEVATMAKLSRGTIYRHFTDKDNLVAEVLEQRIRLFNESVQALVCQQTTLLDKLVEAISWCLAEIDSELFLDLAETEPETVALMTRDPQYMQSCLSFWPLHIKQAIASGELREDIAIDRAADWVSHMVMSLVLYPPLTLEAGNRQQLRKFIDECLFKGLG